VFIGCKSSNNQLYSQVSFFIKKINLSVSLDNRIQKASGRIISFLKNYDSTGNYDSYTLTEEEKSLFSDYLRLLPEKYIKIIEEKVVVVYFIKNFKGGGMTYTTYDKNENMYIVWFLNPEILYRKIEDWINYRDNSYFNEESKDISITVECTGDFFALMHLLLHEASHVYDYYNHITPFTELYLKNKNSPASTDYTKMIWNDFNLPMNRYDFPYRNELYSYGLGPAQSKLQAFNIYKSLSRTPFPSLYGSQNWAEDFAESFAWYYLGKYLNCNYKVKITKNTSGTEELLVFEPLLNKLFTNRFGCFEKIIESETD
jgi:hypothetical protein